MAFSKFDGLKLEDEDDEREKLVVKSRNLFREAEEFHRLHGSTHEAVQRFEDAELALGTLLDGGFTGLRHAELEAVLKGRLHQSAILAQLGGEAEAPPEDDVWPKVRALAEDVLQFDFENSHARWLRGLALSRAAGNAGSQRQRVEAVEEMQRAIACARKQSKTAEVQQWEAEVERIMAPAAASSSPPTRPPASPASTPASTATAPAAATPSAPSAPSAPSLRRGFFGGQKPAARKLGEEEKRASEVANARQAAEADERRKRHADAQRQHEAELDLLRQQLDQERGRQAAMRSRLRRGEGEAEGVRVVAALAEDVDAALCRATVGRAAAEASGKGLAQSRSKAEGVAAQLSASCAWADAQHAEYERLLTEVATYSEASGKEEGEARDAAQREEAELRALVARVGGLKATTSSIRGRLAALGRATDAEARRGESFDDELRRAAAAAAAFRALPLGTRLVGLTNDAAVVRLGALAALCGGILALAFSTECLAALRCGLSCAAT